VPIDGLRNWKTRFEKQLLVFQFFNPSIGTFPLEACFSTNYKEFLTSSMEGGFKFSYASVSFLKPILQSFIQAVMSSFSALQILLVILPFITEGRFQIFLVSL